MAEIQPGILESIPRLAKYLTFALQPGGDARQGLSALRDLADGRQTVIGIGESLALELEGRIEGLRAFPTHVGKGFEVPSTPAALWCWLRGDDRGELLHRMRSMETTLAPAFALQQGIDAFQYGASLDLTGYEDGTENPTGDDASQVATVSGKGEGMDGSSFVAVQQWVHDLDRFQSFSASQQDEIIGRRKSDNEEMDDAPLSAHVKRTAQESFKPEAFVLRRSMPWSDDRHSGLVFVSFGNSFEPFEALLNRMTGLEDGISDALFRFTRPLTGSYFWCPPIHQGHPDLRLLGVD